MNASTRPRSGAATERLIPRHSRAAKTNPTETKPNSKKPPPRSKAINLARLAAQRQCWIALLFLLCIAVLVWRAVSLQVTHGDFLQAQADARLLRDVTLPAHRGMLLDRNGQPLAVSVPVDSVWINPQLVVQAREHWGELMAVLGLSAADLEKLLDSRAMQREFLYLQRHLSPSVSAQIRALNMRGVYLQKEYRRYYPAAEVTAHALGFTNIDDVGQEGAELSLQARLQGHPGKRRVIADRHGRSIALVQQFDNAQAGEDIRLSLDRRLASIAHRALRKAVTQYQAKAASAVLLDARRGEILAINNIPSYNPNDRRDRNSNHYRNRAVTDVFEPGSTLKPFTIAAALSTGKYTPDSRIDTGNGRLTIGGFQIKDAAAYGHIDLRTVIKKSSNVGAAKIALSLPPEDFWNLLYYAGFGRVPDSGLPGEVAGHLPYFSEWGRTRQASLGFGYGVNVSLLQLAQAYSLFARQGRLLPARLLAIDAPNPQAGLDVISSQQAHTLLLMLESVIQPGGTGTQAAISGYRVAGKTGTARKYINGRYSEEQHLSLFVGIAPVSRPRLVVAVMVDEPQGQQYYGGQVAAPLFAEIMRDALRLLNVVPDWES